MLYRTIREQIVEELRGDVLTGRVAAGDSLREQSLARRFGVSRGPIRDALLQLTQEGLLVSKPNCGVRVSPGPNAALQSLVVDLRRKIEAFALEQIWDGLDAAAFVELDEILDAFRAACEAGEMARCVERDMAFHRWIVDRAGDADLTALWLSTIMRMRLRYTRHATLMESYHEHAAVVAAMRVGDLQKAIQSLQANIQC